MEDGLVAGNSTVKDPTLPDGLHASIASCHKLAQGTVQCRVTGEQRQSF